MSTWPYRYEYIICFRDVHRRCEADTTSRRLEVTEAEIATLIGQRYRHCIMFMTCWKTRSFIFVSLIFFGCIDSYFLRYMEMFSVSLMPMDQRQTCLHGRCFMNKCGPNGRMVQSLTNSRLHGIRGWSAWRTGRYKNCLSRIWTPMNA